MLVAEDFVGNWAALDADVLALDDLNEVGVHLKAEAMTDALGAEQDRIVKLRVFPVG